MSMCLHISNANPLHLGFPNYRRSGWPYRTSTRTRRNDGYTEIGIPRVPRRGHASNGYITSCVQL